MEAKDDGERRLAGCKKDDGPPSSAEICERVAGYLARRFDNNEGQCIPADLL